jgi:hypothetical protein
MILIAHIHTCIYSHVRRLQRNTEIRSDGTCVIKRIFSTGAACLPKSYVAIKVWVEIGGTIAHIVGKMQA